MPRWPRFGHLTCPGFWLSPLSPLLSLPSPALSSLPWAPPGSPHLPACPPITPLAPTTSRPRPSNGESTQTSFRGHCCGLEALPGAQEPTCAGDSRGPGGVSWWLGWRRQSDALQLGCWKLAVTQLQALGSCTCFLALSQAMWEPIWLTGCGCPGRGQVAGGKGRGVVGSQGALHQAGPGLGLCRKAPASQGTAVSGPGDSEHSARWQKSPHTGRRT